MRRQQIFQVTIQVTMAVLMTASARSLSAQTVQLPSFRTFSYSGSVLVPDRGSASLGGVSRSSTYQRRVRGQGRSFGAAGGHTGASAHVTIIDHDQIDRELRGLPPRNAVTRPKSQTAVKNRPQRSVIDPDAEGKTLVRYARMKFLAGEKESAYNAYQLAISCLSPKLADLARAEFKRVFPDSVRPENANGNRFVGAPVPRR